MSNKDKLRTNRASDSNGEESENNVMALIFYIKLNEKEIESITFDKNEKKLIENCINLYSDLKMTNNVFFVGDINFIGDKIHKVVEVKRGNDNTVVRNYETNIKAYYGKNNLNLNSFSNVINWREEDSQQSLGNESKRIENALKKTGHLAPNGSIEEPNIITGFYVKNGTKNKFQVKNIIQKIEEKTDVTFKNVLNLMENYRKTLEIFAKYDISYEGLVILDSEWKNESNKFYKKMVSFFEKNDLFLKPKMENKFLLKETEREIDKRLDDKFPLYSDSEISSMAKTTIVFIIIKIDNFDKDIDGEFNLEEIIDEELTHFPIKNGIEDIKNKIKEIINEILEED